MIYRKFGGDEVIGSSYEHLGTLIFHSGGYTWSLFARFQPSSLG